MSKKEQGLGNCLHVSASATQPLGHLNPDVAARSFCKPQEIINNSKKVSGSTQADTPITDNSA
jgi:hypothetical protein